MFNFTSPTPRDLAVAAAGALSGATAALLLVTLFSLFVPRATPSQLDELARWDASQAHQEGRSASETAKVTP